MTRMHFEAAAQICAEEKTNANCFRLAEGFARLFEQFNPLFDRERFNRRVKELADKEASYA